MHFTVDPAIFVAFPGLRLAVAVVNGIDNTGDYPDVRSAWQSTWARAQKAQRDRDVQSHPHVRSWRDQWKRIGVSSKKFPTSIEALLRRVAKSETPFFINPLVDFYNTLSLRHIVPAGGFDLAEVHGDLTLRLTKNGDHFQALDESEAALVPQGEVAYANGQTILTRHFVWRQARTALITSTTRDVFLVAEILGGLESGLAEAVQRDFDEGLNSCFGAKPEIFCIEENMPAISWKRDP